MRVRSPFLSSDQSADLHNRLLGQSQRTYGIKSLLLARVRRHLGNIAQDDALLLQEGLGERLTDSELREALEERGMYAFMSALSLPLADGFFAHIALPRGLPRSNGSLDCAGGCRTSGRERVKAMLLIQSESVFSSLLAVARGSSHEVAYNMARLIRWDNAHYYCYCIHDPHLFLTRVACNFACGPTAEALACSTLNRRH